MGEQTEEAREEFEQLQLKKILDCVFGGNIIHTKIVGVTFEGRQDIIKDLMEHDVLLLEREPENVYDKNAVGILTMEGKHCGYLNRDIASEFAPAMDNGKKYIVTVSNVTGKEEGKNLGCNIMIALNE